MAIEGNQNALGNSGGKTLNDRRKAAKLRGLVIDRCIDILEKPRVDMSDKDRDLYEDILKKLAGTVLPRLNEVSGPDGEELKISFDKSFKDVLANGAPSETKRDSKEQSSVQGGESGEKKR